MRKVLVVQGILANGEDHAGFNTNANHAAGEGYLRVSDATVVTCGFHMKRSFLPAQAAASMRTAPPDLHGYGGLA